MKEEKKFYVALKGLIFCNEEFLVIQRSNKSRGEIYYWELPGGRMEFGEEPEETLLREVKEETGLRIEPICPLNLWTFFREKTTQLVGINFLCMTAEKDVQLSEEHIDYRWIKEENILDFDFHPTVKSEIEKWNWKEIRRKLRKTSF